MKLLFIAVFVGFVSISFGQKSSITFVPKWKVGTTKKLKIETKSIRITDTSEHQDSSTILGDFEVVEETDNYYLFTFNCENIAYKSVIDFYEKLNAELSDYKTLFLKYRIDKKTGKLKLMNWKTAQDFIKASFESMIKLCEKKYPEHAKEVTGYFYSVQHMFENRESVEEYIGEYFYDIFDYFGKKLPLNDSITLLETVPNPFTKTDTISQKSTYYLIQKSGIYQLESKANIDQKLYKKIMKQMFQQLNLGGFKIPQSKLNELDNILIDYTIKYNYNILVSDFSCTKLKKIVKLKMNNDSKHNTNISTVVYTFY